MVALTIIADSFPDWEAPQHEAAARDLTRAVAATAPRSCSARYVLARDSQDPRFASPLIRTVQVPAAKRMLPILWQAGAAARPLDGEFVHAMTPLAPLRMHTEDLGSQSSVLVPNDIAWAHRELLPSTQAAMYRRLVRRAVKLADVILTPTHAAAKELQAKYGSIPVQVLPLAAPTEMLAPKDAAERRAALGLPADYLVTTAPDNEFGRLAWVTAALDADPALPPVVVIEGLDPEPQKREQQEPTPHDRIVRVTPRDLADIGAIIAGALLLLAPQSYAGTGYTMLSAFSSGVPVVYASHPVPEELALDAGVAADDQAAFAEQLDRILHTDGELDRLRVLARDRARSFGWHNTAWQLWETHANL